MTALLGIFGMIQTQDVWTKIDPNGSGDYKYIQEALDNDKKKIYLWPGRVFNEKVVIRSSDVDIRGFSDSIIRPPNGTDDGAILLDSTDAKIERLNLEGFKILVHPGCIETCDGIHMNMGNVQGLRFHNLILQGYHFPTTSDSSGISHHEGSMGASEDIEVSGCKFFDWDYSCFTMWSSSFIRDIRILNNYLYNYKSFGMDWYVGAQEIIIKGNNFRTDFTTTPINIVDLWTKSLFINGSANHISFVGNTFVGGGTTEGYGLLVSSHAGFSSHIALEQNTFRNFARAISASAHYLTIIGNDNNEPENTDGWHDRGGNTNLVLANNQVNA